MLPIGISQLPIEEWTNRHENFTQELVKDASFKLRNPSKEEHPKRRDRYLATTKNFQWLIQHGIDNNLKLRAMGSGWSFTKCGVTKGGIIDTSSLNFSFPLTKPYISDEYAQKPEDLYFLQCGTIVNELNNRLMERDPKRSIKASGASNGQTIAGAMSTGTHGAGFKIGAVHDAVVGLHIVTGSNTHVWIERKSYPVASEKFKNWLDATIIKDDELFEAALVSFGSFGFIHGVMIETEPIFLLEEHRIGNLPYNDTLKKAMTTLDFSGLNLPGSGIDKELYHFEVLFNPHKFEKDNAEKGGFIKFMYKKPFNPDYKKFKKNPQFTYGDDLLGFIQTMLDSLKPFNQLLIPKLVNSLFSLAFKPQPPQDGTMGDIFNYTKFRGKVASAAMAIDIKDAAKVVEDIVELNKTQAFPGGLSLRYVKGTKATLGFTRFEHTCVLELDGIDSKAARAFYEKIWSLMEQKGIHFTLHWGKINFHLNEERTKNMYGLQAVTSWLEARHKLLDKDTRQVFNNKFIANCGLDKELV